MLITGRERDVDGDNKNASDPFQYTLHNVQCYCALGKTAYESSISIHRT